MFSMHILHLPLDQLSILKISHSTIELTQKLLI